MAAKPKVPVEFTGAGPLNAPISGVLTWVDQRFPLMSLWRDHLSQYYAPKNFNFWYFFGGLALLVLVIQILTGIFLVMHYKPSAADAFASVEYIMRDVPAGWFIRYMHSTGASAFFHCGVFAYVSRSALRFLSPTPRADLDFWDVDLPLADG